MDKLYVVEITNEHQSLIFKEQSKAPDIVGQINRSPLLPSWSAPELVLRAVDKRQENRPDISAVVNLIVMRADAQSLLFPTPNSDFEFLPALVDGENWVVLNCLRSIESFVEGKSDVARDAPNGQIFFISKLYVLSSVVNEYEAFTLADSNRAWLFVRASFRERLLKSKLHGLVLREIGAIIDVAE